ncbi:DEAD/DEAH box helicase [Auraticoccus monumenti]|nr:ATP-binding domain-containing protein [Auraticoccus monumenti]
MALDVVYGETRNPEVSRRVIEALSTLGLTGTAYVGYPVLAGADGKVPVDVLLVSSDTGIVTFTLTAASDATNVDAIVHDQDNLASVLESSLSRYPALRTGRRFAVPITTVVVGPDSVESDALLKQNDVTFVPVNQVAAAVPVEQHIDDVRLHALEAALQRVTTIKPPRRRTEVTDNGSYGGIIRRIEAEIANLDAWQKQAAIESPLGPQRIRGLAGSGKTVVLALKAAYWHVQHPEWRIALTFQTRSLYHQLEDLTTRFTFAHGEDAPDRDKLQILHAWGASRRGGLYQVMADHVGAPIRDYNYARAQFGMENAFDGVCRELLDHCAGINVDPIFDAILIDEAQDLPPTFFKLVYLFTKKPKRVVWAYDELQILSEASMPSTEELFGKDANGDALVTLRNRSGSPQEDIVLPKCYRNTPWALTAAHAIGFGLYRDELVQHFDNPQLWADIGYEVEKGHLSLGSHVVLDRKAKSAPSFFFELLTPEDAVQFIPFQATSDQDNWIAESVARDISEHELRHEDVLIVLPEPYVARSRFAGLKAVLWSRGLQAHMPSVNAGVDSLFLENSIAVTHVFRAKGNEAAMVYVVDAEFGNGGSNLVTRRNTIFTAITRSRAWVRVTGRGENFQALVAEYEQVKSRDFVLDFTLPTERELAAMNRLNQERAAGEQANDAVLQSLEEALAMVEQGRLRLNDLTPRQRTLLARLTRDRLNDGPEF